MEEAGESGECALESGGSDIEEVVGVRGASVRV